VSPRVLSRAAFVLVLLAFAAIPPAAAEGATVSVLTWNVQGGTAGDGREPDPTKLAQILAETNPDVVGLQEICEESVMRPEFEEIMLAFGYTRMSHALGTTVDVQHHDNDREFECDFGSALFVRGATGRTYGPRELFPRAATGRREKRKVTCLEAKIGRRFWFCNTHVAPASAEDRRGRPITQRQIESLADKMRRRRGAVVLVGDLNRKPQRDSPLAEQFDEIDPRNRPTHGNRKIDYVLFTPRAFRRGGLRFLEPDIIGTDHRGILATLEIK
jgi:endonuclease/exonuclease/phosphatase family metal-dependent hydrolase